MTFHHLLRAYPTILKRFQSSNPCLTGPVGAGWNKLIEKFLIAATETGLDVEVTLIKEKFACLRIYWNASGMSEEQFGCLTGVTTKLEIESGRTCEECGEPGTLRNEHPRFYWIRTRCDSCEHWARVKKGV